MEQLIDKLISMGMEQFIGESRQALSMTDEIYLKDMADAELLEARWEALDLTKKQRMLINDYIACLESAEDRYNEISYMAGIRDAARMIQYFGLFKDGDIMVLAEE